MLAFALGGAVIILVSLCYGELAVHSATAGGEFLYALQTLGRFPAFIVGWYLTFYQVAVCAFEAIALAWLLRALMPAINLGTAYMIRGAPVTWDALFIGGSAALAMAAMHMRGAGVAIRFQNFVTFGFISVSLVLIACGLSFGTIGNLEPLFSSASGRHSITVGVLWTFATSAYFLNGWQAALHAIEERRADLSARAAILAMVVGIAASTAFYVGVILACSMAAPWQWLVTRDLPAAAAFGVLGWGGLLGTVVLIAAVVSLTKTWSATVWIGTRLLFAQARHGMLPAWFAVLRPDSRAPRNAVLFVTALTLMGIALGRAAIVPIVDALSICSALSMIFCLIVLLRRRRLGIAPTGWVVPGGSFTVWAALLCASSMVGVSLVQPLLESHSIPIEWIALGTWGLIGCTVWMCKRSLLRADSAGKQD